MYSSSSKIVRIAAMVLLFSTAGFIESLRLTSLTSPANTDIWWHLSSGSWILQNHALPRTGLFSQLPSNAWIAATWLYDVVIAGIYRLVGLKAIPALLICLNICLAFLTFLLAGARRKFWSAVGLSAIAQYVLAALQPGPVYFSILFFSIELYLLLEYRRTRNLRLLFWLPLLFVFWANIDFQFVYGTVLLLIFMSATFLRELALRRFEVTSKILTTMLLALAATVLTPYFFHPYQEFFFRITSAANPYLPDFSALGFRQLRDYVFLLLFLAAFVALGLRRSRDPFQIMLLIGAGALSFHAQRDAWIAVVTATAVIGDTIPRYDEDPELRLSRWHRLATACGVVIIALIGISSIPDQHVLLGRIAENYPVQACNFIRQNRLPQPMFNDYQWGGFLTWYLRDYPVAVDSRNDLYGDDIIIQYSRVMNADVPFTSFPEMTNAQTLLLQKKSLMAGAMSTVPAYKIAYSDQVSIVLTKRE